MLCVFCLIVLWGFFPCYFLFGCNKTLKAARTVTWANSDVFGCIATAARGVKEAYTTTHNRLLSEVVI